MTICDRMELAAQVARGLTALHSLKICHGDIKLQNMLVFIDGDRCSVKLSDFGYP